MNSKIFTFILLLIIPLWPLCAQQVSTLLNDPNRQFEAMHWHADGRIYSVSYSDGAVYQIHLDGRVQTLVSGFTALAGGGFDNQGRFYFSGINKGEIYRLNDDNTYTKIAEGFKQPVGIISSPTDDDLLYITEWETSKVTKVSMSTGEVTPFVTRDGISGPDAIIYDWSGDGFLVSNWNNHKIHRVDTAGNVTQFAQIRTSGTMGYVDRIGDYLYVPSFSRKRLYRIDQAGNATIIAGTGGTGHQDGDGANATFTTPNGTCHNPAGDTLLVSDGNTIRVITEFEPLVNTTDEINEASFTISPNPVSDRVNILFQWNQILNLKWSILDQQGKTITTGNYNTVKGENRIDIPVRDLSSGIYTIQFRSDQHEVISRPFVKN